MAVVADTIELEEEVWKNVDEQAVAEERSRDELVDKAIRIYLRERRWNQIRGWGRELVENGLTKEDMALAIQDSK